MYVVVGASDHFIFVSDVHPTNIEGKSELIFIFIFTDHQIITIYVPLATF